MMMCTAVDCRSMTFDTDGHMLDASILSYEGVTRTGSFPTGVEQVDALPVIEETASGPLIIPIQQEPQLQKTSITAGGTSPPAGQAGQAGPLARPSFHNELSTTLQVAKVILGSGMLVRAWLWCATQN